MGFLTDLIGLVARGEAAAGAEAGPLGSGLESGLGSGWRGGEGFDAAVRASIVAMGAELDAASLEAAEAMSRRNRLGARLNSARQRAEAWHREALEVAAKGNEEGARAALRRELEALEEAAALGPMLAEAARRSEALGARVSGLRGKIEDADRNARTLIARRNAARAQGVVREAIEAEPGDGFPALDVFEWSLARREGPGPGLESGDRDQAPAVSAVSGDRLAAAFERLSEELGGRGPRRAL